MAQVKFDESPAYLITFDIRNLGILAYLTNENHEEVWAQRVILYRIQTFSTDGTKLLLIQKLISHQVHAQKHVSMKFYSKFKHFKSRNAVENIVCQVFYQLINLG